MIVAVPYPEPVPGPGVANGEREKVEESGGTCPTIFIFKRDPLIVMITLYL